jgi:hypothetical protein
MPPKPGGMMIVFQRNNPRFNFPHRSTSLYIGAGPGGQQHHGRGQCHRHGAIEPVAEIEGTGIEVGRIH